MDDDDEGLDEGKPPTVSDEELEKLDIEAGFTEIQRLLQMGALRNLNNAELEQGNVLTTKMVYAWRMREQKHCSWRGHFTAREIHLRACQASWNGAKETRTDSRHWL